MQQKIVGKMNSETLVIKVGTTFALSLETSEFVLNRGSLQAKTADTMEHDRTREKGLSPTAGRTEPSPGGDFVSTRFNTITNETNGEKPKMNYASSAISVGR